MPTKRNTSKILTIRVWPTKDGGYNLVIPGTGPCRVIRNPSSAHGHSSLCKRLDAVFAPRARRAA